MKKKLIISLVIVISFGLLLIGIDKAKADVYVKVDAQGNAIDGAIVCDVGTCGDPNSLYSKLTLKEGERYVLQGYGQSGIGNNNPNTEVKVDIATTTWTVTTPTSTNTFVPTKEEPVTVVSNNPVITPITTDSSTVVITDSSTVVSDSATVTSNSSVTTGLVLSSNPTLEEVIAVLNKVLALLIKLLG